MAEMTPAKWLDLLDRRLTARWALMKVFDDMFEGLHPLAFATSPWREAFGSLLEELTDNWCQIVVSSSQERLKVQGFRFGKESAADDDAWAIWQENGLDAQSDMAHTEAIKLGEAYWLVDPTMRGRDVPRITCEHPSQAIVAHAPGDRQSRRAALKRWRDDDGYVYATLYLPSRIVKYRSQRKINENSGWDGGKIAYDLRPRDPGGRHNLGVVPMIPLPNAPSMLTGGRSDIKPGIPLQKAIDKLAQDMMVAAEVAAYPQRVMTGVEQEEDPATGKPKKIEMGVTRLFTVEAPDARVFDLKAADLKNYTGAMETFIQHLAAQTKTPPHYLLGSMINASGDALSVAESGLVSKVRDKMVPFGEGHEEAMRLAFKALGDEKRAGEMDAETLWANPERRSYAQLADAAGKLAVIPGIPLSEILSELGWSPQRIARAQAAGAADAILRSVTDTTDAASSDAGAAASEAA